MLHHANKKIYLPRQGLDSDHWVCYPKCYQLSHPCLLHHTYICPWQKQKFSSQGNKFKKYSALSAENLNACFCIIICFNLSLWCWHILHRNDSHLYIFPVQLRAMLDLLTPDTKTIRVEMYRLTRLVKASLRLHWGLVFKLSWLTTVTKHNWMQGLLNV